jgi:hypothetical protein
MQRDPMVSSSLLPPANRVGMRETADRRQLEIGLPCCDRGWNVNRAGAKIAQESYGQRPTPATSKKQESFANHCVLPLVRAMS